jgi:glycerol kinase
MPGFDQLPLFLCLDQGGHASRALVLDERGEVVTRALREVATQYPATDRVEHDAEEIVASVLDAAREAVSRLGSRAGDLAAAGLATQRSSIVCWDRITGAALSPVISWQDRRASAWLAPFSVHASEIERRTGLRLSPHYGASKLRWCLDHLEPVRSALRDQRLACGPLASFLSYRLTAEHTLFVDPSSAQRTLLWNLAERGWDRWLLDRFGIVPEVLPNCVSTHHAFGHVRVGDRGLPLSVVTGDQAAALFAFGAPRADTGYVNLGTGAFVQRVVREPERVPGLLTGVARIADEAATYTLEGTVNGAGAALAWAAQTLGIADLEQQLPDWLARDSEPPLFLNGVGGLGAPYWMADFPTRFVGAGEPWQQAVAVAESVVFLVTVNLERMQQHHKLRALTLTGGLGKLDGLCQRLADLTGLPAWRPAEHEATASGLAWLLAGGRAQWPIGAGVEFVPLERSGLRARFERWRAAMNSAMN